ncbi:MAG: glycoside hydrolase family 172 protein, partial [Planctomycetota bacterium]
MSKTVPFLSLFLILVGVTTINAGLLSEITRTIEGKTRRASSGLFDPESNQDAYHIGPGETAVLPMLNGPGEIRHMWFTIAGRDRRYPRALVLRIYWDGAETPSVETPIGDFFAAGNGMRANVNSQPIQVTSYGRALNCYWRMPFRKTARIELTNEGRNRLTVYWQFDWMELPRVPDDMLYFHARYRQEFPARSFSPYVIFEGQGDGHYVGTVFSIQCSYGSWFGESDDRFYIDGETEPSIVGTGCEDFFNDAWNLRVFSNTNTGVTIKEANGEDCRFTAYRWHTQAPVTFRKSLKVDIERRSYAQVTNPETGRRELHDFKYRPDFCSSVAFWYQKTIAESFDRFPSFEERINPEIFLETSDMTA